MTGYTQKLFQNIVKNTTTTANDVKEMAENYRDAMEFLMEKELYSEFLEFQVSKSVKKV
jgi:hypothetical protein